MVQHADASVTMGQDVINDLDVVNEHFLKKNLDENGRKKYQNCGYYFGYFVQFYFSDFGYHYWV